MTKTNNVHILTVNIFTKQIDKPSMTMVFKFNTIESLSKISSNLHSQLSESFTITIGPDDFNKCETFSTKDIIRVSTSVQQDVEEIIEDAAFKKILERIEEVKRMLNNENECRPYPWITPYVPPMTVYYGVAVTAYATPDPYDYGGNWTWTTGELKSEEVADLTHTYTTIGKTFLNNKK